jgi:hypothetical protein
MSDKPLGDPLAGPSYKGFAATPERPRAPGARPRRRRAWLAGAGLAAAALAAAAGLTLHHPGAPPEPAPPRPPPEIASAPAPASDAVLKPPATTKVLDITPPPPAVAPPPAAPRTSAKIRPVKDRCGPKAPSIARILCEDPQVASLDREVNAAFAAAMRDSTAPGALADDQEGWILRRDRTAREDPDAVADLYRERIAVLRGRTGQSLP